MIDTSDVTDVADVAGDVARALELLGRVPYGVVATSVRAMPFLAPARHVLTGDGVVLRLHGGPDCLQACDGGVVAYGADNLGSGAALRWSVQLTGTAHAMEPGAPESALLGPVPRRPDGSPYTPAYLRLRPRFAAVHALDATEGTGGHGSGARPGHHAV
ncbi:pyridoxamine 5'-phosphate oxidase family protein [Streptomyces sp. NPDC015131]|uniref:pyridoxamine 5'-phosphate oxidase family protein n=1 Tax=Streptomyces sp. NPDC015131 TaxID=3364941 RepID=UPI0036FDA232